MKRGGLSPVSELAPYATDPAQSRGRVYPADASRTRTPFQRDRDRIIHSAAFRRLQYKTQVFLHHEGRHFRTRLTHTLEVSQIARSFARSLRLCEDLAEAVALAHDLGHPPFGHAGERVLHEKMGQFGGFDHNIQALRVVTLLESRYALHPGLNLTRETLDGILKHNGPLVLSDGRELDGGVDHGLPFGSDRIAQEAGLPLDIFAGLEAQAAAIADDIAYNSHDIDDAVRAGLLTLEAPAAVPLAGPLLIKVQEMWPGLDRSKQRHELQRRLITTMVEDVIETTSRNLADTAPASVRDVHLAGHTLVTFSARMAEQVAALKSFLFDHVYRAEPVMQPVRAGEQVVAGIFDSLMANFSIAGRWKDMADAAEGESARARVVCDFIAGMTDPFATELYKQLFDDRPEFL